MGNKYCRNEKRSKRKKERRKITLFTILKIQLAYKKNFEISLKSKKIFIVTICC
jgi:hypothetical protein